MVNAWPSGQTLLFERFTRRFLVYKWWIIEYRLDTETLASLKVDDKRIVPGSFTNKHIYFFGTNIADDECDILVFRYYNSFEPASKMIERFSDTCTRYFIANDDTNNNGLLYRYLNFECLVGSFQCFDKDNESWLNLKPPTDRSGQFYRLF